ncbi:MAG TPA: cold shock domain-containing protein [Anaerolineaceae bacterium]
MAERYTAVLKWMGGEFGYGFMVEQDGREVFVCYDPLPGEGFRVLMEGESCAFEIAQGRKGLTAANISQSNVTPPRRFDRA